VIEPPVTPQQAGHVFARLKPRLAAYSHIVQPQVTEQDLTPQTRMTYSGSVEVGEDLMVIVAGDQVTSFADRLAPRGKRCRLGAGATLATAPGPSERQCERRCFRMALQERTRWNRRG
jgi:hypothetical protein